MIAEAKLANQTQEENMRRQLEEETKRRLAEEKKRRQEREEEEDERRGRARAGGAREPCRGDGEAAHGRPRGGSPA